MVDNFAILIAHIVIVVALWRLLMSDAIDVEPPAREGDGDA